MYECFFFFLYDAAVLLPFIFLKKEVLESHPAHWKSIELSWKETTKVIIWSSMLVI